MAPGVQNHDIVVIGASVGGTRAVLELVSQLPADLPASLFLVVHLAPGFVSRLPELLSERGPLRASHPVDGERLQVGHIYVAPPDTHLLVRSGYMNVVRGPKENGQRPSVDLLFRTASAAYGSRVIGVVLTGQMDCGTAGLISIKSRAGLAVVQDPDDAEARSMPDSAIAHAPVDHVVPLSQLAALLTRLVNEPAASDPTEPTSHALELEGDQPGHPSSLVCPVCQGALSETQANGFQLFRCHLGHTFSLSSMVAEQAESVERALWAAARALEEAADLTARLAKGASGALRMRFDEKERDQRQQVQVIRQLIASHKLLRITDAPAALLGTG